MDIHFLSHPTLSFIHDVHKSLLCIWSLTVNIRDGRQTKLNFSTIKQIIFLYFSQRWQWSTKTHCHSTRSRGILCKSSWSCLSRWKSHFLHRSTAGDIGHVSSASWLTAVCKDAKENMLPVRCNDAYTDAGSTYQDMHGKIVLWHGRWGEILIMIIFIILLNCLYKMTRKILHCY